MDAEGKVIFAYLLVMFVLFIFFLREVFNNLF